MITFIISLLVLLFYCAVALLALWGLAYIFEMVFNRPVPPRAKQLVVAMVAIIFLIWLLESLVTHTPIPAPWALAR